MLFFEDKYIPIFMVLYLEIRVLLKLLARYRLYLLVPTFSLPFLSVSLGSFPLPSVHDRPQHCRSYDNKFKKIKTKNIYMYCNGSRFETHSNSFHNTEALKTKAGLNISVQTLNFTGRARF